MPRKKLEGGSDRRCVVLFEGDFDKLQRLFPAKGASFVIRQIVRQFLVRVEAAAPKVELEIDIKDIGL